METKTYPLYTLEFPASEEKSKNEPEYFQIVRWDNRTKLQKEVDRRTYFYFIGSSGVHLKDVLTDVLKFNEKAHDVPEEYLLERLYNNWNISHFTDLGIRMYISKYAHEYTKNPKNADKKSDKKYVVICYAVHNEEISSCDIFTSENEAYDFLDKDAENTYKEEVENSGNNTDNIELDIDGDTAKLINHEADCIWTWHMLTV